MGGVDIPAVRRFEVAPGREFDAEVKLLENAANLLEQIDPGLREGTLNLFVDSPSLGICESCLGVVSQFNQLYPGIQVNIYVPITISYG